MIEYIVDPDVILLSVKKDISRAAGMARGDDGSPLYDAYKVLSRDTETLQEYLGDAVSAMFLRLYDIASRSESSGKITVSFDVPDFDMSLLQEVTKELGRFMSLSVCSYWFLEKGDKEKSEEFAGRSETSLTKAHVLLKSRKTPKRNQI